MTKSNTADQNPFTAFTNSGGQPYAAMQKGYQNALRMTGRMAALNRQFASAARESVQLASKSYMAMNVRAFEFARQAAKTRVEATGKIRSANSVREIAEIELACAHSLAADSFEELTALTGLVSEAANKSTDLVSAHAVKWLNSCKIADSLKT